MKRTIDININGQVFHIEEGAYDILNDYIDELNDTYSRPEDKETVSDIEARIAELFAESLRGGKNVVTEADVEHVLAQLGRPSQFEGDDTSNGTRGNGKGSAKNNGTDSTGSANSNSRGFDPRRRMYRNPDNKVLGGVCSGLAARVGWDPVWVRLLFVLLACFTDGIMLPLYIILWIIMPKAETTAQKIEMNGGQATAANIHRANNSEQPRQSDFANFLRGAIRICIWFIISILLVIAAPLSILILIVMGASVVGLGIGLASVVGVVLSLGAVVIIPLICGITALVQLIRQKPMPRWPFWVICLVLWVISLGGFTATAVKNDGFGIVREKIENFRANHGKVDNSDKHEYTVYTLDPFTKIETEGLVALEIVQGEEQFVSAQDGVDVKCEGGKLKLTSTSKYRKEQNHVKVTVKDLTSLETSGVSAVTIKDAIECDYLRLDIEGVSAVVIEELHAYALDLEVEGTSGVNIEGYAKRATYHIEGMSAVDLENFEVNNVNATCEGACAVKINASESLVVDAKGACSVEIYGTIEGYTGNTSGLSKITRK